ncbi:hypothetical protein EDB80DRAFT_323338 [Ilyonectria destructans]|nr:hypothetical protein EDB80DRAFT_323338 [Ilyonectria destructans]
MHSTRPFIPSFPSHPIPPYPTRPNQDGCIASATRPCHSELQLIHINWLAGLSVDQQPSALGPGHEHQQQGKEACLFRFLLRLSGSMRNKTKTTKATLKGGWTLGLIGRATRLTRLRLRVGTGDSIHPSIPDPDSTKTIDLGRKSNHRHTSSPRCPCHPSLAAPVLPQFAFCPAHPHTQTPTLLSRLSHQMSQHYQGNADEYNHNGQLRIISTRGLNQNSPTSRKH